MPVDDKRLLRRCMASSFWVPKGISVKTLCGTRCVRANSFTIFVNETTSTIWETGAEVCGVMGPVTRPGDAGRKKGTNRGTRNGRQKEKKIERVQENPNICESR